MFAVVRITAEAGDHPTVITADARINIQNQFTEVRFPVPFDREIGEAVAHLEKLIHDRLVALVRAALDDPRDPGGRPSGVKGAVSA